MKCVFYYHYPVGRIGIAEKDRFVIGVFFAGEPAKPGFAGQSPPGAVALQTAGKPGGKSRAYPDFEFRESEQIRKTAMQLDEYFAGKRREFDLPLLFEGTDFQKRVWAALLTIPYGETRTYGEIAAQTGNPKACRAVGLANNRNPIAIICPCHRVIGADGSLTGYGGGLPAKEYLLALERR